MSVPNMEAHDFWCAACLTHRVQLPSHYYCPACDERPRPTVWPAPRMYHDRDHVSTSAGEA